MRVLVNAVLSHHHKAIDNFLVGFNKEKHEIHNSNPSSLPNGLYDICICWGVSQMEKLKKFAKIENFVILENSYLNNVQGKGKEWVSAGWNGLNGRADFCNKNSPDDRWKKHFNDGRLKEYTDGDYILIPLQIQGDQSLNYIWSSVLNYQYICETIRKFTDLPIIIRDHPTRPNTQPKIEGVKNVKYDDFKLPIQTAIGGAKCVVTINSNAGVDSVLGGKPVISLDKGSMVWNISDHDFKGINSPKFYDRTQWCNDIAYAQWHPSELKSGEAWEHLKKLYEK
jgi:hypothetical protein